MGGFCGVISKGDCVSDLFFGTDYHSHLGTHRGGMAVLGEKGFQRSIHNIQNSQLYFEHYIVLKDQLLYQNLYLVYFLLQKQFELFIPEH